MNNCHVFLIRPDHVTQLAAHLVAGIVVLVLTASMAGPRDKVLPESPPVVRMVDTLAPPPVHILASNE